MNYKGIKDQKHYCQYCGKLIEFRGYTAVHKFCDNICQGKFRTKQYTERNIKLFKEGKLSDISRSRIKRTMLRMGVEKKCAICGITEWLGKPLPFVLDHIDGKASNNTPENLRLICSNCDSQSEHYKAKNKGSGRQSLKLPTGKPHQ